MECAMADNNNPITPGFGLILGGILVASAAFFILTGGEFGGEKKVRGDADLPPVVTTTSP
jgi:hypothetical protein